MAKASTPSFVLQLPLVITKEDECIILSRLEAGRRLYNAVLDEALKRLSAMRSSAQWQAAKVMPVGKPRNEAFKSLTVEFGFSEYALHAFVKLLLFLKRHPDVKPLDFKQKMQQRSRHSLAE